MPAKIDWVAGEEVTSAKLNALGVEINDNETKVDAVDAMRPQLGLTIVETATGVWSGDAPSRAPGINPILFVGWSDPADPTNGIVTPANIQESDVRIRTSVPA